MSFKTVATLDADVTIKLGGRDKKTGKANPTSAEGYYLGTREVTSPKSKTGKARLHFLQTSKGNVAVWGKTDMDRKLANVNPGNMIKITFDKMVNTPNGEMYKYTVAFDADNTIDVEGLNDSAEASDGTDSGDYEEQSSSSEEYDDETTQEEEEDNAVPTTSALSALERKNKVEQLLKGNKTKRN